MTNEELERELQEANDSIRWWQNKYNALDKSNDIWLERIERAKERLQDYDIADDKDAVVLDAYKILNRGDEGEKDS